ncbi:Predicted membrane protein [Devosia crocina]|uniref:Predicted membrane protein n=1 Tax=Devosia crocina TaxID=429728 RepID=A0A1I7NNM3_9HYPH|nr:DUF2207 domain-containing protein [Devosia crocina]SFV36229.1 Predicted membrane protein [Devosia crocina]
MPFAVRFLLAALVVLVLALPTQAREEILSFASDVTLRVDGSVAVVETVDVRSEMIEIRRGIYRDIPTVLLGPSGNKIRVDFDVHSVTRNGAPEAYRVERMGNFQRIWIGDSRGFIGAGDHRYVITYTMARMARPFEEHDELYWNATGNYWNFPILRSVARVTLPQGATITKLSAYTGAPGSTEQAVSVTRTSDTEASFRTQRILDAGEGMTFAVSFEKGVIAYPEGLDALLQSASDLREIWLPVFSVLILLAYNMTAWWHVGRDPPKGTIIPLFHPPKDFSPALTHFVHSWGFQQSGWTAFTAAIFNLGVRGLVAISNSGDALSVKTTGKSPQTSLPVGEEVIFRYLEGEGTVTVDKSTGPKLNSKRGEFTAAIERENRKVWFNHNFGFVVVSFLLAFVMIGAMVSFDVLEIFWLFAAFVGGIFAAVIGSLIFSALSKGGLRLFIVLIWVVVVAFNSGGGMLEIFSSLTVNSAALAAASLILISVIFAVLMRAPTIQGRKVMDEIDGFKLYLDTAEKNRLNISGEPPMTVDRFERILPYAIALGVEKPWTEHFEGELSRNAVADRVGTDYNPRWYSGRNFSAGNITSTVSAASSGMAAAMIAAQPVQASSSGSSSIGGGGGGFSGGGGGGGGGGGW